MIKSNGFPWVAATCEMITQELCFPEAADSGTEAVENKNAAQNNNKHSRVII